MHKKATEQSVMLVANNRRYPGTPPNYMQKLIETTKRVIQENVNLPFSVYSSVKEQRLLNVPVLKPLLIFVLSGHKKLGESDKSIFSAGNFVFLSNTPNIAMRNIPGDEEYFAILIEFDYSDFDYLTRGTFRTAEYFHGPIDQTLQFTLQQFVEWSTFFPSDIWSVRRQEILKILLYQGFTAVADIMEPPTLTHKLHTIIKSDILSDFGVVELSSMLSMSESTLRRKLNSEGTSFQTIKDRVKLGHGLHLVQTTLDPIGLIAEQCGYTSQSRFTDKFKKLFDITPSELRKTRLRDLGE